jgi:hypothetical protein
MNKMIALTLALISSAAISQTKIPEIEALPMDKLETLYWDCDYMSSVALLDSTDAAICSAVFERMKAEKFGGDFNKFMQWWKPLKDKEHAKRAKK